MPFPRMAVKVWLIPNGVSRLYYRNLAIKRDALVSRLCLCFLLAVGGGIMFVILPTGFGIDYYAHLYSCVCQTLHCPADKIQCIPS